MLNSRRRDFREVSEVKPCPVCCHASWCRISTDGAIVLCRRTSNGASRIGRYQDGGEYYVHRLLASRLAASSPPQFNPRPEPRLADANTLHQVYTALLDLLTLDGRHVEELRHRGLTGDLRQVGYRTWPLKGRAYLARQLIELGLERHFPFVPGFRQMESDAGRKYWTIGGSPGLFIPNLDAAGRIIKLLLRLDEPNPNGGKYSALSSRTKAKMYGPGPGAPIHVPHFTGDTTIVRITEGVLKANVATTLGGVLTLGLPSAVAHRDAVPLLHPLGARTVRLAFDADARRNLHVARALKDLAQAVAAGGLKVELETWDEADGKGIDDLLFAGKTPHVLTGDEALAEINATVAAAKSVTLPAPAARRRVWPDPRRPGHYIIDFTAEVR